MEISPTTSFPTEEHAQEHLEGLIEDGHDEDEMKEFIKTHGAKDFVCYYEDYARMVEEYDQETVNAFLEEFDLMDVEHLEDAYNGQYRSEAEFAENFVTDMGYAQNDMPYWIAIDWQKTWDDGLSWDYTFNNGFVFCNNW
jgi:antirestriction protein